MTLNWLEIAVLVLLLICTIMGFRKGLLKQGLILLGALILLWLMSFLLPYTKQAITQYTPIETWISKKVDAAVQERIGAAAENMLPGDAGEEDREKISEALEKYGADSSDIDLPALGSGGALTDLTRAQQTDLINTSPLPGFLKDILLENNNSEIYNRLGVDHFIDYLKEYLTELVINILAYVTSFILAFIIYRLILAAAHLVDHLPLARALNHGFGGVLGLVQGLVILGLFFTVLLLLCRTEAGRACYECIEESRYLTFLYEHNPIMAIVTAVTG